MDRAEPGAVPYLRSAADSEMIVKQGSGGCKPAGECMNDPRKPNNLRTALILASVALMFALGLVAKRLWLG